MGHYGVAMGHYVTLWGTTGCYGALRGAMGWLWGTTGRYGALCAAMGHCVPLWGAMGPRGSLRPPHQPPLPPLPPPLSGRFHFRRPSSLPSLLTSGLAPLRYADDSGAATVAYPMNPNGSPGGVAALCSPCGRHLAVMPHPERGVLRWQWPWWPQEWGGRCGAAVGPRWGGEKGVARGGAAPWLKMFLNAREWCRGDP